MFTGIVDHCGKITRLDEQTNSRRFFIETEFTQLVEGESIAVDGICLTVVEPEEHGFYCDVSAETLRVTAAQQYFVGQSVNLERAMRASDRFGGHIVLGHIDSTATLKAKSIEGDYQVLRFSGLHDDVKKYLVPKGSVCVNGVSLTINSVDDGEFTVMVIPHTLERTNLKLLNEDDTVNIECDYLARVVVQQYNEVYR